MTTDANASRPPLTNAQKQAAWRKRHKEDASHMQQQIASLTAQLAAAQATIDEQRDDLAALARHIAQNQKAQT